MTAMSSLRRLVPALGLIASLLLVPGTSTAGAATLPAGAATLPTAAGLTPSDTVTFIEFGPLRTSTGQKLTLDATSCAHHGTLGASYSETRGKATLIHIYNGRLATCRVNAAATSGSLSAKLGDHLSARLTLTAVKMPTTTRHKIAKGCYDTTTTVKFIARGRLAGSIDAARLGTVERARLTAELTRFVTPACTSDGGSTSSTILIGGPSGRGAPTRQEIRHSTELLASWDGFHKVLSGLRIPGFSTTASFDEPIHHGPAGTTGDEFAFDISGAAAFAPATNLARASLNFDSPFSTGSLTFTAGTGCPSTARARSGSIRGTVTVHDPILGSITLRGTEMGTALLTKPDTSYNCSSSGGGVL